MADEKGKGGFQSFNDKKTGKAAAKTKGSGDAMARRLAGKTGC